MKIVIIAFITILANVAFAVDSLSYKVEGLKPAKISKLKIGKMTAHLIDEKNNELISTVTSDLGDCETCLRGYAVRGDIGIRLDGADVRNLKIFHKRSPGISLNSCGPKSQFAGDGFECSYIKNGHPYKMVFQIER